MTHPMGSPTPPKRHTPEQPTATPAPNEAVNLWDEPPASPVEEVDGAAINISVKRITPTHVQLGEQTVSFRRPSITVFSQFLDSFGAAAVQIQEIIVNAKNRETVADISDDRAKKISRSVDALNRIWEGMIYPSVINDQGREYLDALDRDPDVDAQWKINVTIRLIEQWMPEWQKARDLAR